MRVLGNPNHCDYIEVGEMTIEQIVANYIYNQCG